MNLRITLPILCALLLPTAAGAQTVYTNDFESGRTDRWHTDAQPSDWRNPVAVSATPDGERNFLGEFGNQSVQLVLDNLPPHDSLVVSFDLLILRSWDGNVDPDIWQLAVDDSLLLSTTFSNVTYPQAFPGWYPNTRFDERTGAVANNSLGFTWSEPTVYDGPLDSYYRLAVALPHTGTTATISFAALLKDVRPSISNESWGIDNVVVRAPRLLRIADGPSPGDRPAPEGDTIPHNLADVAITMSRSACFGRCPVYTVTIYGNGTVEFYGNKFVAHEGPATDSIAQEDVVRLVRAFQSLGFFSMQDRYDNRHISDLPATTTTFTAGDTTKRVYNYFGAPEALRELERLIDRTAGTARWIQGDTDEQ